MGEHYGNSRKIILKNVEINDEGIFKFNKDEMFIQNKIALMKMVYILRSEGYGFNSFYKFLIWYFDNLFICESLVVYSAMIFGNVSNIKPPKNMNNKDLKKVLVGIENQAWDIYHLTQWKKFLSLEEKTGNTNFFVTNDISLKMLLVNSLPNECPNTIYSIFTTKKEQKIIDDLMYNKVFQNRIQPFGSLDKEERYQQTMLLLEKVENDLRSLIEEVNNE